MVRKLPTFNTLSRTLPPRRQLELSRKSPSILKAPAYLGFGRPAQSAAGQE